MISFMNMPTGFIASIVRYLIHKAGEKLFIDFCGKKPWYVDKTTGEQIEVEVFIAVLPCSQYTFITAAASQKREEADQLYGIVFKVAGVPQAIVSDNLKSAVSKGSKYAPVINKTFSGFARHYGCAVDPARPHHPQDKALVEYNFHWPISTVIDMPSGQNMASVLPITGARGTFEKTAIITFRRIASISGELTGRAISASTGKKYGVRPADN